MNNDDEKKPVVPGGGTDEAGDTPAKDTMVGENLSGDSKPETDISSKDTDDTPQTPTKLPVDIDITAALKDDGEETEEEPEEEMSELDRELGRVEGIESTAAFAAQRSGKESEGASDEVKNDGADDDKVTIEQPDTKSQAVDLDPVTEDTTKENPLVSAMRKQEKDRSEKKSKLGIVTAVLAVLFVGAAGAAGFFYMKTSTLANDKEAVETERTELAAKNSKMRDEQTTIREQALKEARETLEKKAENGDAQAVAGGDYVTIRELGVRYKQTDANKSLIHGYTVTTNVPNVDSVAFSTASLARLSPDNSGASPVFPCAFTGNVPVVTRYAQDMPVGNSTASKVGKKIGEAFYVYTAPVSACLPGHDADITARDTAAKAVFDSLEALPSQAQTATAKTTTPAAN